MRGIWSPSYTVTLHSVSLDPWRRDAVIAGMAYWIPMNFNAVLMGVRWPCGFVPCCLELVRGLRSTKSGELPSGLQGDPNTASAFNICLEFEGRIQADIDSGKDMEKQLIYCRILGYLLQHIPSQSMNRFVQDIVATGCQHERLLQLGEFYYNHFIRNCSSPIECIHHPHRLTRLYFRLTNSNSQM